MAEGTSPEPLARDRYDLILLEMHEAQLKALQSAHDSALYEVQRLKQRQQSGTQEHLVVSEKRQLALLIGKTQRARKALIRKMTSHVRYIMDNMENQNIPVNWKTLAMQGEPYWIDSVEESAVTPSTAEKNSIVESYLKRQRAWEQITVVLPRETVDAMHFFGDLEKRSNALMRCLPREHTSREINEYDWGCWTVCFDVRVKAREYRLRCRDIWSMIENGLQLGNIIAVTSLSGEGDGVPAYLKVNATLPLIEISQQRVYLLREDMVEQELLQE